MRSGYAAADLGTGGDLRRHHGVHRAAGPAGRADPAGAHTGTRRRHRRCGDGAGRDDPAAGAAGLRRHSASTRIGLPNRKRRQGRSGAQLLGSLRHSCVGTTAPCASSSVAPCCIALAVPFLSIQFGMPDDGSMPTTLSQRQAYDLMEDGFGPGVNAPARRRGGARRIQARRLRDGAGAVAARERCARCRAAGRHDQGRGGGDRPDPELRRPDHRGDLPGDAVDRSGRDGDDRARRAAPERPGPGDGRHRPGRPRRRRHGDADRPHPPGREVPAAGDRCGGARGVRAADAGVPLDPRAAEGGGHEPAVDRRRLRRRGRGVPVGLGTPAGRASPRRSRSSRSCRW